MLEIFSDPLRPPGNAAAWALLLSMFLLSCGEDERQDGPLCTARGDDASSELVLSVGPTAKPYMGFPSKLEIEAEGLRLRPTFENLTFANPVGVYPVPGTRFLVVPEREGRIVAFENDPDVESSTVALDLREHTQGYGDGGMLGLAFHPDFGKADAKHEKSIFIHYLYSDSPVEDAHEAPSSPGYSRLSRFDYDATEHTIDPESEQILIDQYDENVWHQGGALFFHPGDGFLYFAVGDEGNGYCRLNNCQVIDKDLFSGVLRLDVDQRGGDVSHPIKRQPRTGTTAHYYIPNDNPFVGEDDVLEEFYALGLRSPHRMTYDPVDDLTWIGEVGQSKREEVNILTRGANFGWDLFEGTLETERDESPDKLWGHLTPPLLELDRDEARSLIGGYVYRGTRFVELWDKYLYADYRLGTVSAVSYKKVGGKRKNGQNPVELVEKTELLRSDYRDIEDGITSFGIDHEGELYFTTLGEESHILTLEAVNDPKLNVPARLSKTGLLSDRSFEKGSTLSPVRSFLPYGVNSPLFSDGAVKTRFLAVPQGESIGFEEDGPWRFPAGTILLKHFEMPLDLSRPSELTRIETRVLVVAEDEAYGVSYRWNDDQSEARVVLGRTPITLDRKDADGDSFEQEYTIPSSTDCLSCHTKAAGFVLGVRTAQQNGEFSYEEGCRQNQLQAMHENDWVRTKSPDQSLDIEELPRLSGIDDESAEAEHRVRSYWDANCSMCHRPGGVTLSSWDARIETPLSEQGVLGVSPTGVAGDADDLLIAPGNAEDSLMLKRVSSTDPELVMPPLGRNTVDTAFVELLRRYIEEQSEEDDD